ncbi:unnamed protein product [Urochloa humidicola]
MDRDEEMGHGDRSLLFIGDEDDDLGADPPTSSDEGSFSERSDDDDARAARGGRGRRGGAGRDDRADAADEGQKGTWPQSYRQSIDMLSAVPSPTMSTLMAASPSLTKFGSSFLKEGSSFFLKKGEGSGLPLTRPLLPPSASNLSQSSLHQRPTMARRVRGRRVTGSSDDPTNPCIN